MIPHSRTTRVRSPSWLARKRRSSGWRAEAAACAYRRPRPTTRRRAADGRAPRRPHGGRAAGGGLLFGDV